MAVMLAVCETILLSYFLKNLSFA